MHVNKEAYIHENTFKKKKTNETAKLLTDTKLKWIIGRTLTYNLKLTVKNSS